MPFPDVTFPPGTTHDALLEKLQRFIQSAMPWWKRGYQSMTTEGPDHGLLIGLGDDDHSQYLNAARHTAIAGDHVTNGDTHNHAGGDGGQVDHGGLSGLGDDDHTQYVLANGTRDIDFSSGSWNVGNVAGGHFTAVEADGTIVLNGNATVWDDMRVVPGSFDRPGVSDPSIETYNVNGGGINTYLWGFDKDDIASFTVQLPHGYMQGENIKVHIHWTPGANGAANNGLYVGWKIDYSWTNVEGNFGTMATADLSDVCDGTNHKHQMTPEVSITGSGKNISSMLICNVKRTDTGADDTWSTGTPLILEIDFHYPIDTIGSRNTGTK